jgi:N-acetyl-anhydromuramyl-L-alanine amidase AmpD
VKLPITQIPAISNGSNWWYKGRRGHELKHACIHYSVGSGRPHATARYIASGRRPTPGSYHFEVATDGMQAQMVDTDDTSFHAKGVPLGVVNNRTVAYRVNCESIGIVCGNWGHMTAAQARSRKLDPKILVEAGHRGFVGQKLWPEYPLVQIQSLAFLLIALQAHHTLQCITGHEDHERGKQDPGPAFPWPLLCRLAMLPYMHHDWKTGRWVMLYDHRGEPVA